MTTFSGPAGVATFRAVAIKSALRMYANTGMQVNRAYTPKAMLAAASEITGKPFKRGQYKEAIAALESWLAEHGTNGESSRT